MDTIDINVKKLEEYTLNECIILFNYINTLYNEFKELDELLNEVANKKQKLSKKVNELSNKTFNSQMGFTSSISYLYGHIGKLAIETMNKSNKDFNLDLKDLIDKE